MKKKAGDLLKKIVTSLGSIAKAKSVAIKNKTSAFKTRLIMLSLMKNKKLLFGSISNKIHSLLGRDQEDKDDDHDHNKAAILYNAAAANESFTSKVRAVEDGSNEYPDLTHSLFDEVDLGFEDQGGSIVDMVRSSREEEGESFSLEAEIDHVADLFISRFHKQMRLQKLLSFKRQQEMLQQSL